MASPMGFRNQAGEHAQRRVYTQRSTAVRDFARPSIHFTDQNAGVGNHATRPSGPLKVDFWQLVANLP